MLPAVSSLFSQNTMDILFLSPGCVIIRITKSFPKECETDMRNMENREIWVWLPEKDYPDRQTTYYTPLAGENRAPGNYTVAEFAKTVKFEKPVSAVSLRVSADTAFRLYLSGERILSGPATPGGDFLSNDAPRPQHYATLLTLDAEQYPELKEGKLPFTALVRMMPARICEFSRGHGGFMLDGHVTFADGTEGVFSTDESWQVRLLGAHTNAGAFDGRIAPDAFVPAQRVINRWNTLDAPIPGCEEHCLVPDEGKDIPISAGETKTVTVELPMVYAGYVYAKAKTTSGTLKVSVHCCETAEDGGSGENLIFGGEQTVAYTGFTMHSAGLLKAEIENDGGDAVLSLGFVTSCYPVTVSAKTVTSDNDLNAVFNTCAHTLQYCRQTHHLDSPRHCEPMACTGDYYIESLMTAFTFGDMRLAAFDVRRTAQLLRYNDGRMFHTTYSLIWVQMLWDTYQLTGETALLSDCRDALYLLLTRFSTYLGENGIIENPPDYMFIDWLCPDGISMHHPPKALGQTCLNLYYFGALNTAAKIYDVLRAPAEASSVRAKAEKLHEAILANLWDAQRGLFFEGLNTPTPEHLLYHYMPQNVEKRYYRMHANILAAYFGFFAKEDCAALLERILTDKTLGEVQPYFMHFLLDAVYRNGLRDEWTVRLLEQWKEPVRDCPKGLAEGFYKPEPTYHFDHSHAWGGTPAYALPLALSGLELLKPGFAEIRLSPSLLGLDAAAVEIPAPQGMIVIRMTRGEEPEITVPAGIAVVS